jgi:HSP20 family protein
MLKVRGEPQRRYKMFERYALIRREPITDIVPFETEVERFFGNALSIFDSPVYVPGTFILERPLLAPMEVFDSDGNTVVRLELPGMTMEDIDISVSKGLLTIKGEKKEEKESKEEGCYCSERVYGSFRRTLSVPKELKESNIHATYDNGVLEVLLSKVEEKKERKAKVQTKKAKG